MPERSPRTCLIVEGLVTIRPASDAAFDRFVGAFLDAELPVLERSGVKLVGAWRADEPANSLLHLYRFADLKAMQDAGRAMATDPGAVAMDRGYAWVDDPEFHYRRLLGSTPPFAPTDLFENHASPSADVVRPWLRLRQRVRFCRQEEAFELMAEQFEILGTSGVFQLAAAWDTIHGEFGDVASFGVVSDVRTTAATIREATPRRLRKALDEVLCAEEGTALTPVAYSPLR